MLFGLKNVSSTYCQTIDVVFKDKLANFAKVFVGWYECTLYYWVWTFVTFISSFEAKFNMRECILKHFEDNDGQYWIRPNKIKAML
jgi:hypothetical protein